MNKTFQKFFGWFLVFAGVASIFWGLYSSYNIFNGKTAPPEIFKTEQNAPLQQKAQGLEAQVEQKVKDIMGEQIKSMIPSDSIPKIFNLLSWSILAGILIFGGTQLANVGIKLLKEEDQRL